MKLRALKPGVTALSPRLARPTDAEGHVVGDEGRSWYHLARWKHPKTGLRMRVFIRDQFTCQMCGRIDGPRGLHADHKIPHRGNARLFWSEANVQTLCQPCHVGGKQREERGGAPGGEV